MDILTTGALAVPTSICSLMSPGTLSLYKFFVPPLVGEAMGGWRPCGAGLLLGLRFYRRPGAMHISKRFCSRDSSVTRITLSPSEAVEKLYFQKPSQDLEVPYQGQVLPRALPSSLHSYRHKQYQTTVLKHSYRDKAKIA